MLSVFTEAYPKGLRRRQQDSILAEVLGLLVSNYARHEAAPVQWNRDANCYLVEPNVTLQIV